MKSLIIVGGGAAGMTAAVYARRAGIDATILEANVMGGQIALSSEVENFPSILHISGWELSDKIRKQAEELGAAFITAKVTQLEPGENSHMVTTENAAMEAGAVILASGAARRKLGCPGEAELAGKGVSWCAMCDGPFFKDKAVAVVGGGNTALEEALYLSTICRSVALIHRRLEFSAQQSLVDEVKGRNNIRVQTPYAVRQILGGDRVEGIILKNEKTKEEKTRFVSGVFIAIGMEPQSAFCAGVVNLDAQGYFDAGEDCYTNIPGIYAAGDCRRKPLRQLVTAMADGAVAATAAAAFLEQKRKLGFATA